MLMMLRTYSKQLWYQFIFPLLLLAFKIGNAVWNAWGSGVFSLPLCPRRLACVESSLDSFALCFWMELASEIPGRDWRERGQVNQDIYYSISLPVINFRLVALYYILGFIQLYFDNSFHCILSINF